MAFPLPTNEAKISRTSTDPIPVEGLPNGFAIWQKTDVNSGTVLETRLQFKLAIANADNTGIENVLGRVDLDGDGGVYVPHISADDTRWERRANVSHDLSQKIRKALKSSGLRLTSWSPS